MGLWQAIKLLGAIVRGECDPVEQVVDPVLGELNVLGPNPGRPGGWIWMGSVSGRGRSVEFSIGGGTRPAEPLIQAARRVIADLPNLEAGLSAFLDAEAQRFGDRLDPLGHRYAELIRELRLRHISIWSEQHPKAWRLICRGREGAPEWDCLCRDGKFSQLASVEKFQASADDAR